MNKDILDTIKSTDDKIIDILSSKEFGDFMKNTVKQAIKDNTHITFELNRWQCRDIITKLFELVDWIGHEDYEGNLLDNYLFYANGGTIEEFSDYPPTNYIILEEKPLNCYESTYKVTLTNDDEIAKDFETRSMEYWDKVEREERESQLI